MKKLITPQPAMTQQQLSRLLQFSSSPPVSFLHQNRQGPLFAAASRRPGGGVAFFSQCLLWIVLVSFVALLFLAFINPRTNQTKTPKEAKEACGGASASASKGFLSFFFWLGRITAGAHLCLFWLFWVCDGPGNATLLVQETASKQELTKTTANKQLCLHNPHKIRTRTMCDGTKNNNKKQSKWPWNQVTTFLAFFPRVASMPLDTVFVCHCRCSSCFCSLGFFFFGVCPLPQNNTTTQKKKKPNTKPFQPHRHHHHRINNQQTTNHKQTTSNPFHPRSLPFPSLLAHHPPPS